MVLLLLTKYRIVLVKEVMTHSLMYHRTHQHRCYRLKNRLRLGEMWLSECTNEYVLSNHQCDSSFIIGWPLTNCIAMFRYGEWIMV